jgi:hypothetical protein
MARVRSRGPARRACRGTGAARRRARRAPREIFDYAVRAPTRAEHRLLVRAHAGFRPFTEDELDRLRARLVDVALEHERPSLLLARICEVLRGERVERPSIDRLLRLVGWTRERAHEQTFQRLAAQLTDPIRATLNGLLTTEGGQSQHAWLRSRPPRSAPRRCAASSTSAFLIEQVGADRFDLSALPPNRRSWLAQTGRQSTNQALGRLAPERRYPVLMAFCAEALERATDDALEVFDRALGGADRAAQRKRQELERRSSRDTQATVRRFVDLTRLVLEAHDARTDVLRLIDRRIGLDRLREDLARAERIARPHGPGHLDLLLRDLRRRGSQAAGQCDRQARAAADRGRRERAPRRPAAPPPAGRRQARRWLPGFSPSAFVDAQWREHVVDVSRGRLDRRAYELCAAYALREALRAGRVWVPGSRRYTDPASLLLPDEHWQQSRVTFARAVEQPVEGAERLRTLASEQAELLERLARVRDAEAEARLLEGELVVEHVAEVIDEGRLRKLIEPRLPEVDLPDLLIEVDGWTGFTDHLTPLSGNRRRSNDMPCVLYAVIVAQATNLGLSGMTRASQFSYQQLEWAWEQYCREPTLTAASASLVDYHYQLPLAQAWGAGRLSSSDGQRFAIRRRGPGTAALPRYFGHRRRGLQIYSWTSDQYSQYASKVVAATVRDATHTLDGILDNQTVLPVEEHTTDTHGYTEMIFGAYDLLGLRFAPRIRDLDRQRLYRHGPARPVETAELLKHKIRPELITPYGTSCCASPPPCGTGGRRHRCCSPASKPGAGATRSRRRCRSTGAWSRRTSCSAGWPTKSSGSGSAASSTKASSSTPSAA